MKTKLRAFLLKTTFLLFTTIILGTAFSQTAYKDYQDGKIWIRSYKNIKKGDELTYDYGFAFDKDDFRDHVCKCGTRNCVGFIVTEADWKKLQKFLLKLAKTCTKTN